MAAYDSVTKAVSYGYYYNASEKVFVYGGYSIDPHNSYMGMTYFEE